MNYIKKERKETICINISGTSHMELVIVNDGEVEEGFVWLRIRNRRDFYTLWYL